MHCNIPLISGTLKYSVYELADITDRVKFSSHNKKTEKNTGDIPISGAILGYFIQFNVVFHSLCELSFHGNIKYILFIHVHHFEDGI